MKAIIAPSILTSDFAYLHREIAMLNESEADWIHVDVMDGVFVPNISIGLPVVEAIKRHAKKPLDVHLMIINPEKYVDAFRRAGADSISIHIETCPDLYQSIKQIKELGAKAGVAINPLTPVADLESIIQHVDIVNVMSVNPGFGAQKFMEGTYQKVKDLKALIIEKKSAALIEIDGGVNLANARALLQAGADILVTGSLVFGSPNPKEMIHQLKSL